MSKKDQFLKLRRSAVPGKIPDTSSIDFGEIALNTYDGLAFMKKSGSNGEEIIAIGTTSISASYSLTSSYSATASYLIGQSDTASYALTASYFVTSSVTSASYAVTASYLIGQSSTSSYSLTASYVETALTASYFITGSVTSASYAVTASYVDTALTASYFFTSSVTSASYAISSSHSDYAISSSNSLYALSASYAANVGFNYTASYTNQSTWVVNHDFNYRFVIIQAFDSNYKEIIPENIELTDSNTATVYFPTLESGYVIASVGGAAYFSTVSASYSVSSSFADLASTASYFSGSISNATNAIYASTASYLNPIVDSYVVLSNVSQSLNFVDDAAAALGGVPLGGLYRNGNFILIRIS